MRLPAPRDWLAQPARIVAILAGWALVGLAFLVGLEIILRKLFNTSLQGADEIGGYVVAVVAAFGFALALLDRAHTRIEIFTERLPATLRALLNVLALASIAVFAVFMAWRGAVALFESIDYKSLSGTPLMTPLWMPQLVWVAGLVFFAIVAVLVLLHSLLLLRRPEEVNAVYSARSLDQEIEEERRSVQRRSVERRSVGNRGTAPRAGGER